jgi:gluconate:H+ symporter, GntP family
MHPLLILAIGMALVVGAIVVLRLNAFLALIAAAILVSLLAPGPIDQKITRVAEAFGTTAGNIAIVIGMAAIVGQCMMESGAADRVVRAFVALFGEARGGAALSGSGFVLAIPVFFDTVFYLLIPLARSMFRRTGRHYLRYVMAICAGGAVTHTLVPPTPGPLVIADTLRVDLGTMIVMGIVVGLPATVVGLAYCRWLDRRAPVPMRPIPGMPDEGGAPDGPLPPLLPSLLPILLPVLLISMHTIVSRLAAGAPQGSTLFVARQWTAVLGNANLALIASAAVALLLYVQRRRPSREQAAQMMEGALMSAGIIILITAGGGAFGAMLRAAQIGPAIQNLFAGSALGADMTMIVLAFFVASLLKFAQGSSTVAMITTAGMMAAMMNPQALSFHPVHLALAIGAGSLVGSWMNDSGFWIYCKMGGMTESEALRSWTVLLAILGVVAMVVNMLFAVALPLRPAGGTP